MLRNVLFVRKFVEKAHESSFPLGNEIQVAQPVRGGPRGTKWGLHNLYFDWASSSRATDNVGYISLWKWSAIAMLELQRIQFAGWALTEGQHRLPCQVVFEWEGRIALQAGHASPVKWCLNENCSASWPCLACQVVFEWKGRIALQAGLFFLVPAQ